MVGDGREVGGTRGSHGGSGGKKGRGNLRRTFDVSLYINFRPSKPPTINIPIRWVPKGGCLCVFTRGCVTFSGNSGKPSLTSAEGLLKIERWDLGVENYKEPVNYSWPVCRSSQTYVISNFVLGLVCFSEVWGSG